MASTTFRPLHDRVVVRRVESEAKTKGGIIIPDTAKEKPQEGEVVAVGSGARDESGKLRFPTVGLSVPRQSGKTFGLMMLVIAESLRHKGLKTVWTTHRYKVTRETFREFVTILNLPAFTKHVEKITTGEGNQGILFRNGSRIIFAARENGALRGVSKIGRLVLDESQILSTEAVADLIAAFRLA